MQAYTLRSIEALLWVTAVLTLVACGNEDPSPKKPKVTFDSSNFIQRYTLIPTEKIDANEAEAFGPVSIQQYGASTCLLTGWSTAKGVGLTKETKIDASDTLLLASDGSINYSRTTLFGTFSHSFSPEAIPSTEHLLARFSLALPPDVEFECPSFWAQVRSALQQPVWCWAIQSEGLRYCTIAFHLVNPFNSPIGFLPLRLKAPFLDDEFSGTFTGPVIDAIPLEIATHFTTTTKKIEVGAMLWGTVSIKAAFQDYSCEGTSPATMEILEPPLDEAACMTAVPGFNRRELKPTE